MEHSKQDKKRKSSVLQEKKNQIFRLLPRVDDLMKKEKVQKLIEKEGYERVLCAVRGAVDQLRNEIAEDLHAGISESDTKEKIHEFLQSIEDGRKKSRVQDLLDIQQKKSIHPVYNGTGVILHTGLGRAPLPHGIAEKLGRVAENYSSLEYDLSTGKRGNRTGYAEELLCQITGAEAALVVNNNAGAVLLVLTALTKDGEAIVSRGELVEIGGKFRIPEVMELSGTKLREVGTTNRTRIDDYERAAGAETKAFLKVHTSNYRIIGFTESVDVGQLKNLSEKLQKKKSRDLQQREILSGNKMQSESRIPVIEDLGSGVLVNLEKYGLLKEPTVQEEVKSGADIVCFSGDKLLGGAQAGLIVGKKEYINQMRNHPLLRALRADKFTLTALEEVLKCYLDRETALQKIPVLKMMTSPVEEIKEKAVHCCSRLDREVNRDTSVMSICVEKCTSKAGGGSLPEEEIPSFGVSFLPYEISVGELEKRMRNLPVPVIGRIKEGRFLLDMRTFAEEGIDYLERMFPQIATNEVETAQKIKTEDMIR